MRGTWRTGHSATNPDVGPHRTGRVTWSRRRVLLGALLAPLVTAACGDPQPPTGSAAAENMAGEAAAVTTTQTYHYGAAKAQAADLLLPAARPHGVVVLVHGGYWQRGYDRTLEDDVAADLVGAGWAVWNLDYRAVGDGGGWPGSFDDVAAGTDHLAVAAREHGLALDTVVAVGHSAGGTLALGLAARSRPGAPESHDHEGVGVTGVVTQAGVNSLFDGWDDRLGGGAVASVMGGSPQQVPERYAAVDPTKLLPLGVPVLVVTGTDDDLVPSTQSRDFAAATQAAGDDVRLEVVTGEGHVAHLEPGSGSWRAVRAWLDQL